MSTLSLELITTSSKDYQARRYISVRLVNHVHKRLEHFRYLKSIAEHHVPLDYFASKVLNSRQNVLITDRSYQLSVNSNALATDAINFSETSAASFSSPYKELLFTHKSYVDEYNNVQPLFYKHKLPSGTVSVNIEHLTFGNKATIHSGYLVDLDVGCVYTNYRNEYDLDTGSYSVYLISSVTETGEGSSVLLNVVPAIEEATWEDIDPETGLLNSNNYTFSRELNSSGYTFYFSKAGQLWSKPVATSLISCKKPIGKETDEGWYLRITNGDLTTVTNGGTKRYYVPEYLLQAFQPSAPYVFTSYGGVSFVNEYLLKINRESLGIDPEDSRHVTMYIYDYESVLINVWTTDQALHGKRYSNTEIFYDATKIVSWDNDHGFIALSDKVLPSWQVKAEYYYKADDYELIDLNINPVQNPDILKYTIVVYVIPNVTDNESAVHYLLLDHESVIRYTSQKASISYPNLSLSELDGSYNPNTIIGLKYISDINPDTFVTLYSAGYENSYGYLIIGEVNVVNNANHKSSIKCDVRRQGRRLAEKIANVLEQNINGVYSIYGFGIDGQTVPQNAIVIQIPLDILSDYGGVLSAREAINLSTKFLTAGVYPIIEWTYPQTETEVDITIPNEVSLYMTYEGNYQYNIYKKSTLSESWTLIETLTPDSDADLVYTDTNLASNKAYYYAVRLKNVYEYPAPYYFNIRVS